MMLLSPLYRDICIKFPKETLSFFWENFIWPTNLSHSVPFDAQFVNLTLPRKSWRSCNIDTWEDVMMCDVEVNVYTRKMKCPLWGGSPTFWFNHSLTLAIFPNIKNTTAECADRKCFVSTNYNGVAIVRKGVLYSQLENQKKALISRCKGKLQCHLEMDSEVTKAALALDCNNPEVKP